ncbi:ABC transporter ATP-binding protein [Clostridiaceae bacterium 35-E11]
MPYIEVKKVDFCYPQKEMLFKNISIDFSCDEFTAIIGHNGSGKTTLGKLLVGIYKPISGDILIKDENTKKLSLGQLGKKVGYLFQNPNRQLFTNSVIDEISFPMKLKGIPEDTIDEACDKLLDFFELNHLRNAFPFNLSQGERQRVALAAILVNKPEFLILDEPTTGLDHKRKEVLSSYLKNLKKQGIGIVAISHDMDFVEKHADRKILIAGGEIVGDHK